MSRTLRTRVRDNSDHSIRFAKRHGFVQKNHSIEMMLDLTAWDDQNYEPLLQCTPASRVFIFTNMAELGDTQDARRKLYALNNGAAATDPGSDGIPPWASFEEFERDVCNSSWYHPDGQIVAIDTQSGEWAAMSAITVFAGSDHAYNLFTGTDVRYRGRKLAQAVKTHRPAQGAHLWCGCGAHPSQLRERCHDRHRYQIGLYPHARDVGHGEGIGAWLSSTLKLGQSLHPSWISRNWIYAPDPRVHPDHAPQADLTPVRLDG